MKLSLNRTAVTLALAQHGWTMVQLAQEMNCSRANLYALLKRGSGSPRSVHKLAAALDVDVAEIVMGGSVE